MMMIDELIEVSSGERPHPSPLPEGEGTEGCCTPRASWLPSPAKRGRGWGWGPLPAEQQAHWLHATRVGAAILQAAQPEGVLDGQQQGVVVVGCAVFHAARAVVGDDDGGDVAAAR